MDSDALLTRINLSSINWMGVPGGKAEITRQDIMAALAMGNLEKKYYQFAMLYYCGDTADIKSLEIYAWDLAIELHLKHGWQNTERGQEQLRRLARLALLEILTTHRRVCQHCNGDGKRPLGSKMKVPEGVPFTTCPRCCGAGNRPMSESDKALTIGIPKSTWHQVWADKYRVIHSELQTWTTVIARHVNRHIG